MARKISPESVKNAQLEFGSDKIIIEAFENARPHELNQTISEISTKDKDLIPTEVKKRPMINRKSNTTVFNESDTIPSKPDEVV